MIESGFDGSNGPNGGGAGVVSLDGTRRARREHGVLGDVQRYWNGLRADRLVPLRSEIDPRGIEGALDSAFIVERIAPGIARFRLAGSFLVDLMGAEVRGMPLSILFAPGSRGELSEAVEGLFGGPEIVRLDVSGERGLARPGLRASMLLLPLKSDLGDISRALGCISTVGEIGRTPRRLEIRAMGRTDLVAPARRAALGTTAAPGEPADARLRPVPGAPHLRVVEPAG